MNTAMIDVALGLVLLYAVLSLFVTTVQELLVNNPPWWGRFGALRSRYMEKAVRSAFGEDRQLAESFFAHPLIVSLAAGTGDRKPSYIPDDVFAKVFLTVLGRGEHPAERGLTPDSFLAALQQGRPDTAAAAARAAGQLDFVDALKLATQRSTADWPTFEKSVATWFFDIGERSRGWFKRSSQRYVFVLSLVTAVGFNVDSVMIARTLWADGELRQELAAAAMQLDAAVQQARGASAPAATAALPPSFEQRLARIDQGLDELITRMGDASYLRDDNLIAVACNRAKADNPPLLNGPQARCQLIPPTAARDRRPRPEKDGKTMWIVPVISWPDEINDLRIGLDARRSEAGIRQWESLQRSEALKKLLQDAERSLSNISEETLFVQHLVAPTKAAPVVADLNRRVRNVQHEVNEALKSMGAANGRRGVLECEAQFAADAEARQNCIERRGRETVFNLPLGYDKSVLVRQVSQDALQACDGTTRCELATWEVVKGAWLGWLLTAIALSLGAPFWFDVLSRVVKLRAAGTPVRDAVRDDADRRTDDDGQRSPGPRDGGTPPGPQPQPPGPDGGTADVASDFERQLTSDEIRTLQQRLMAKPTGFFGPETRQKIAERRRALGLPDGATLDGALYEAILERRSLAVAPRPTLRLQDTHELVPELRRRLTQLLGLPPRAQGSGDTFDVPLRAAVRLFQGRAGLEPDGIAGAQTWMRLDAGGGAAPHAEPWMSKAIAELGLNERDAGDVPQILRFLQALPSTAHVVAPTTTPWCGCFVAFVLQQGGHKTPPPAVVPEGARNWIGWGQPVDDDRYGAVAVLRSRDQRHWSQHHVAFMVGKTASGWVLLGGNQGDKVSVELFAEESWELVYRGV